MQLTLSRLPRFAQALNRALLKIIDLIRYWPVTATPFDPCDFEQELRHVLRTLADAEKLLEVNTRVPLHNNIVKWWREEGGRAVTFGSDAHEPSTLAAGFADAMAMVEAFGFRRGRHPYDVRSR